LTTMAAEKEKQLKKRLNQFLGELLQTGSINGFRHFVMYMRGREEMMISVMNEPGVPYNSYTNEPVPSHGEQQPRTSSCSNSLTSSNLPYDKRSLLLSARTQLNLSGLGDQGVGLPPASPSDREISMADENSTLFLIAGYSRYNNPYVWVRANHARLAKYLDGNADNDSPLRLKSTLQWAQEDIKLWDILAELVKLCTYPPPINPFEVDFDYFENLPAQEQVLASGAMISFLQKVFSHRQQDKPYTAHVLKDLNKLTEFHFKTVASLLQQGAIPLADNYRPFHKPNTFPEHSNRISSSNPNSLSGGTHGLQGYKFSTGMI
ncbi:unnamed protein product, partial [Owenia fusiformis]